jgi:hypothetical protein
MVGGWVCKVKLLSDDQWICCDIIESALLVQTRTILRYVTLSEY